MTHPGKYTKEEILSQPTAWESAMMHLEEQDADLRAFWSHGKFDQIVLTGCGSTYYLSLAAAAVLQGILQIPARAYPASELWLNPDLCYLSGKRTLLVPVSRSGATTETLRACETFRTHSRGGMLTLSCYAAEPLASLGDRNLVMESGAEQSIAQTRAFSTLYLTALFLASAWCEDASRAAALRRDLNAAAEACRRVLSSAQSLAGELGRDMTLDRFYFLGSGVRYGLASELSLKMKEMSLSHSEPFHFLEFRHGPKSMITPGALVVGLFSAAGQAREAAVTAEMTAMGARTLLIGEESGDVVFASGMADPARSLLCLPVGQLMALERSLAKGLDPDSPNNLDAVVRLEKE